LPGYTWQKLMRRPSSGDKTHLIIALADHFEPSILPGTTGSHASRRVQEQRLDRWFTEYPKAVRDWPDSDGRPFRHTYFYPAEQYDSRLIDGLADHCQEGWGEIEIHLHHGLEKPDTAVNTRRQLVEFREALATRGCLSRVNGKGDPRYAFVHGILPWRIRETILPAALITRWSFWPKPGATRTSLSLQRQMRRRRPRLILCTSAPCQLTEGRRTVADWI
jgi:hypothetical protein